MLHSQFSKLLTFTIKFVYLLDYHLLDRLLRKFALRQLHSMLLLQQMMVMLVMSMLFINPPFSPFNACVTKSFENYNRHILMVNFSMSDHNKVLMHL